MAATRKACVPMAEQIRLINECRQSGMTDADWCRENGIAVSTFITESAAAGKQQRVRSRHRLLFHRHFWVCLFKAEPLSG